MAQMYDMSVEKPKDGEEILLFILVSQKVQPGIEPPVESFTFYGQYNSDFSISFVRDDPANLSRRNGQLLTSVTLQIKNFTTQRTDVGSIFRGPPDTRISTPSERAKLVRTTDKDVSAVVEQSTNLDLTALKSGTKLKWQRYADVPASDMYKVLVEKYKMGVKGGKSRRKSRRKSRKSRLYKK